MKKMLDDNRILYWFLAVYDSSGKVNNAGKLSNYISCHNLGQDYILSLE